MAIRFRKRVKLLPGIFLNFSKRGVSTSVGTRGLYVTKGHGKTRTNVGIPGTGVSYNTVKSNSSTSPQSANNKFSDTLGGVLILLSIYIGYKTHWSIGLIAAFVMIGTVESLRDKIRYARQPDFYIEKQDVLAIPVDLEGNHQFDSEVVGESFSRDAIRANLPEQYQEKDFRLYFAFTLLQDDHNPHDPNAVAIQIGNTLGHLPKARAKAYRTWAAKTGIGKTATCRGAMIGRAGTADYGIWLDLPDF